MKYERLKIAHKQIQISHDLQSKAYTELLREYRTYKSDSERVLRRVQEEKDKAVRIGKRRWKISGLIGFAIGIGFGTKL